MAKGDLRITIHPKSKTTRSLLPDIIDQLESMVKFLRSLVDEETTFEVVSINKNSPLEAVCRPLHRVRIQPKRATETAKRESFRATTKTSDRALRTVNAIRSNTRLPSYADVVSLSQLREFADDLEKTDHYAVVSVQEQTFTVDESLIKQIDSRLGRSKVTSATFTGRLGRVNAIGRRWSFTIEPLVGPNRILCYFDKEHVGFVRGLVTEVVTVRGSAVYRSESPWPESIRVTSIQPKTPAPEGAWLNLPDTLRSHWLESSDAERDLVAAGVDLD